MKSGALILSCRELAHILVRHAKDIKTPLTKDIPQPSYIEDTHHHPVTPHPSKEQDTTLFRELIKRMPSETCWLEYDLQITSIYA